MTTCFVVTIEVPLAKPLPSLANSRLHWRALAALKAAQRHRASLHLRMHAGAFLREWRVISGNPAARLGVTLTRISPRALDCDNNVGAFKAIRDQVADEVGLNDRSKRFEWTYAQERGSPGYRLRLEVLTAEVVR